MQMESQARFESYYDFKGGPVIRSLRGHIEGHTEVIFLTKSEFKWGHKFPNWLNIIRFALGAWNDLGSYAVIWGHARSFSLPVI